MQTCEDKYTILMYVSTHTHTNTDLAYALISFSASVLISTGCKRLGNKVKECSLFFVSFPAFSPLFIAFYTLIHSFTHYLLHQLSTYLRAVECSEVLYCILHTSVPQRNAVGVILKLLLALKQNFAYCPGVHFYV